VQETGRTVGDAQGVSRLTSRTFVTKELLVAKKISARFSELSERKTNLLIGVFLFLLTLAVYWPVLNNTIISDDYDLISRVSAIPFPRFWQFFTVFPILMRPRPLAFLLLWVQAYFFGAAGLPGHLINVALHSANAFLLYWLIKKMGIARVTALAGAAFFVLAPVAPEAVTWSTVRFDLMVLTFMLLSLGLYLGFLQGRRKKFYVASLICAAAAIFSKETGVVLLVLIPALDILFAGTIVAGAGPAVVSDIGVSNSASAIERTKKLVQRLAPFYILVAGFFVFRILVTGIISSYPGVPLFGRPYFRSAVHTFWTIISPFNDHVFSGKEIKILGGFYLLSVVVSLIFAVWQWRKTSPYAHRAWMFFIIFFTVSLVPVFYTLFVYGIYHGLRDSRYLYIPTFAFAAVFMIGLVEFGRGKRYLFVPALILVFMSLAFNFVGIVGNNRPWQHAAQLSASIPEQAVNLLPDPPAGSRIYFKDVPEWDGAYVYLIGLPIAVGWQYERDDLVITRIRTGAEIPDDPAGFYFQYDAGREALSLVDYSSLRPPTPLTEF